ncbi:MAG: DEAD/DEAH box helicase [Pseudomonadota bacterium]
MTDHLTTVPFSHFDLEPALAQGVKETGFTLCTPIQAASLPLALQGRDVAGQAQTGTGKTAAFVVAALQWLLTQPAFSYRQPHQPRALVLAPTRELAMQIHHDAEALGRHTGFSYLAVIGGTGYDSQRQHIDAGVDFVVGTPGRIIDFHRQGVLDLRAVQVVVLDEADRMFDLGFIKDIRYLLRRLPRPDQRLGMLFSATLSWRVLELAYEHMNNPELIRIEPDRVTVSQVTQACYMVGNDEKISLLLGLMRHMDPTRSIVFVNTKREAERVWGYLEGNGIHSAMLSGDVPQKKRFRLLMEFQSGAIAVLVATDVAARGLHIPEVSHIFNYDLPQDAEDYVHRIGRTARAGASGDAISFACEHFAVCLPDIEAFIGQRIPVKSISKELLFPVDPRSRIRDPEHYSEDRDRHRRPGGSGGRVVHNERRPPRSSSGPSRPAVEHRPASPPAAVSENTVSPPPRQRQRRRRSSPHANSQPGAPVES